MLLYRIKSLETQLQQQLHLSESQSSAAAQSQKPPAAPKATGPPAAPVRLQRGAAATGGPAPHAGTGVTLGQQLSTPFQQAAAQIDQASTQSTSGALLAAHAADQTLTVAPGTDQQTSAPTTSAAHQTEASSSDQQAAVSSAAAQEQRGSSVQQETAQASTEPSQALTRAQAPSQSASHGTGDHHDDHHRAVSHASAGGVAEQPPGRASQQSSEPPQASAQAAPFRAGPLHAAGEDASVVDESSEHGRTVTPAGQASVEAASIHSAATVQSQGAAAPLHGGDRTGHEQTGLVAAEGQPSALQTNSAGLSSHGTDPAAGQTEL